MLYILSILSVLVGAQASFAAAPDPAKGKAVLESPKCATCHGAMKMGGFGPVDKVKDIDPIFFTQPFVNSRFAKALTRMPPNYAPDPTPLTDAERADMIAYAQSQRPASTEPEARAAKTSARPAKRELPSTETASGSGNGTGNAPTGEAND